MINIPRWEQRLDSYHKALARLAEIVGASKSGRSTSLSAMDLCSDLSSHTNSRGNS